MHTKPKVTVVADRALTFAFVAFLTIPLVGTFCGWDAYEVQENRRPAAFPDLATTPLAELPDALDAYYEDHFGFRNILIRRWNRLLSRLDKNLLRRVIRGRDDWLFYDRPDVILDFLGRRDTTDQDLEFWCRAIEGRERWLAERGIHYVFGVAPNKPSVYPEMLPEDLAAAERSTRLDLLVEYMETHSDVRILDLRPVLRGKKGWKTLYLSNDTHWNAYGAFLAYRAVIERLRDRLPSVGAPLELSECRITTAPFYGDLARFADLPRDEFTLPMDTIDPPGVDGFVTAEFVDDGAFLPDRTLPDGLDEKRVYRNPEGRGRAVVFHDSFFITSTKLVAHHFGETTCIVPRANPDVLTAVVERQRPEVVIEVMVERMLYDLPEQSEAWDEARRRRAREKPEEK